MRKLIKLFKSGNVCVTGLRGSGKDILFGNVIARRKKPYISNLQYTKNALYQKLDFQLLDCGKNCYDNFLNDSVNYYEFPYLPGSDVYISDIGVYLPSQYCNQLNNKYPYLPVYQALSRQVSHNNVHFNVQNLNRAWDKMREQSDIYIMCNWCHVIFGFVVQKITIYDKYQSCIDRVPPCRIQIPLFAKKEVKMNARLYVDKYICSYGSIRSRILIYKNRSQHDTYYFEKLLKEGKK